MGSDLILNGVPFYKMQGCGNDFVLFDNRQLRLPVEKMPSWAKAVCRPAFGVGADGIIWLEQEGELGECAYRWHFYNADGSRAEMCGNGSRCAAKLAHALGLAPANHSFLTDAGPVKAEVRKDSTVKVELTSPGDLNLNISLQLNEIKPPIGGSGELIAHYVNTGVPHVVVPVEDLVTFPVKEVGRMIRGHEAFAPAGTNVNFVNFAGQDAISVRTYERGVEDETQACGTGAAAAAVVGRTLGFCGDLVQVTTSGGEILEIEIAGNKVFLAGAATLVFCGNLDLSGVGLPLP